MYEFDKKRHSVLSSRVFLSTVTFYAAAALILIGGFRLSGRPDGETILVLMFFVAFAGVGITDSFRRKMRILLATTYDITPAFISVKSQTNTQTIFWRDVVAFEIASNRRASYVHLRCTDGKKVLVSEVDLLRSTADEEEFTRAVVRELGRQFGAFDTSAASGAA